MCLGAGSEVSEAEWVVDSCGEVDRYRWFCTVFEWALSDVRMGVLVLARLDID